MKKSLKEAVKELKKEKNSNLGPSWVQKFRRSLKDKTHLSAKSSKSGLRESNFEWD